MMAGYLNGSTINVTYKKNPQRYTGGYVTEDFFKIIGVSPILGRDFTAEDNKPGSPRRPRFSATKSGSAISMPTRTSSDRTSRINGKAATIIGVMPPGFKFPISEELWTPLYNECPLNAARRAFLGANNRAPAVMGRLKPGVTLDQANAEMIAIARHIAKDNPKTNQTFHLGQRAAAAQCLHRRATAPDRLGDARRGHSSSCSSRA